MASYKPGNRTKTALITTAKKFFYEKGYDNTSVKEICVASDVPTSAITYHFGGKEYLAQDIYEEMIQKLGELADRATAACDNKLIRVTFPYYLWWELLYSDEHIRRFAGEMYLHRVAQASAQYDDLFQDYEDAMAEKVDHEQLRMVLITYLGTDSEVLLRMQAGEQFDKEKLLAYIFRTQYFSLGARDGQEDELYNLLRSYFPAVKDQLIIFRNFAYTVPRGRKSR